MPTATVPATPTTVSAPAVPAAAPMLSFGVFSLGSGIRPEPELKPEPEPKPEPENSGTGSKVVVLFEVNVVGVVGASVVGVVGAAVVGVVGVGLVGAGGKQVPKLLSEAYTKSVLGV